ncbi:MAG: response regulator [Defluviitaleaceae bacterium]|nr:response regulator [Defluviitaleaceae bacterium]
MVSQNKTTERDKIIIVDDDRLNLKIAKQALDDSYDVIPVTSGEKLLATLEKIVPSLILLDMEMPGMNGIDTLRALKAKEEYKSIPVIFLTARNDESIEIKALELGASDYLTKPFSIPRLNQRVRQNIRLLSQQRQLIEYSDTLEERVLEQTEIIYELKNSIVQAWADMVEFRDDVTSGHISRTKEYIAALVKGFNKTTIYKEQLANIDTDLLLTSSQLHDIGKIAIEDKILKKPGALTSEEFAEIKKHASIGEQAIRKIMEGVRAKDFLEYAAVIAASHHEKWDGTGYPNGLKGEDIPLIGRIMAIADVYDALVSERPYKTAFPHEKAVEIIMKDSGTHFDPKLCEVFGSVSDEFKAISFMR